MFPRRLPIAIVLAFLCGCASSRSDLGGLREPARAKVETWSFSGMPAKKVVTPHYVIYTTLTDDEVVAGVAQVMELSLIHI